MIRTIVHLLIFALLLPQTAFGFNQSRMDQVVAELEAFRDATASEYSAESILDNADYEADQIISLVRTRIQFEPYAGVLRGPDGTLRSLAGNAHDQAITLASLLNDAGFEAQIVRGTLSDAEARQLLSQFRTGDSERLADPAVAPQFLREIAEAVRPHGTDLSEAQAKVAEYARTLWIDSKADGLISRPEAVQQTLIDEAREYRWVRYRDGAASAWEDIHPVFANEPATWAPKMGSVESGSVSPESLHTVTLQLFMRRDAGRGSETVPLTDPLTYTAANLTEKPITFEIGSDASAGGGSDQSLDQVMADSYLFYPLVNGAIPAGLKVFDLNGRTYPAASMQGLDSIFATLGRTVDTANARLSELGQSSDPEKATAQGGLQSVWLELGYHSPGLAQPYQVERELYSSDRDNPAAAQLLQRWTLDVSTARPVPAYYDAMLADTGTKLLKGYQAYVDYSDSHPDMTYASRMRAYSHFVPSEDRSRLLQLRHVFDSFDNGDARNYAHVPQLLATRRGFNLREGVWHTYELVDIIANTRRSLSAGELPVPEPLLSFTRGVWETRMEVVGRSSAPASSSVSAFNVLAAQKDWSSSARGGIVVLDSAGESRQNGWWAVDPSTGSSIGMLETPWGVAGAEMMEYLVNVVLIAIGALLAGVGAYACAQQAGNSVECCIGANVLLFFVGLVMAFSAGMIAMAYVGVEATVVATGAVSASSAAGMTTSAIAGVAADIVGLGIPVDCRET